MYLHNVMVRTFVLAYFSGVWLYGLAGLMLLGFFSFPFFGLFADVCLGRYKAILIGMILCFISWILGCTVCMLHVYNSSLKLLWFLYIFPVLFGAVGYGCFKVNIVQFNIDQLVGASANELNTIIYWHTAAIPVIEATFRLFACFFIDEQKSLFLLGIFMTSGVTVSIVLVSYSLCKDKVDNVSLIQNPIKLMVRVLCYARNHKYPENRSALTYWEEEAPSRIDLGKNKYGGPFTEEEVEDVKTSFRMLPFFIAVVCYSFSFHHLWHLSINSSLLPCLLHNTFWRFVSALLLLFVYLLFVKIFFYKYVPSMLFRINVGLIAALFVSVSQLIILKFTYDSKTNFDNKYTLFIPHVLEGITFSCVIPASLEFTIAQSPIHTRGLMMGIWHASWGFGCFIYTALSVLFHCLDNNFCTSFYFYLTKSILTLFVLIVFTVLAKRYKYRVRGNEVNIVQIVDDHYQRYMEQEDKYMANYPHDDGDYEHF